MTKIKKYDYRVVQGSNGWTVEIIRKISSKKTGASKSQDGFASEAEAQAWGEVEVKTFVQKLSERNKRKAD